MANKFEEIERFAKNFSNKYKVNFSFEKYHSQKLDKNTVASVSGGDNRIAKENLAYRCTLVNLYRECVENVMKLKYESFNPRQLATDFEKLMNHYREHRTENGKRAPAARGGWEKGSDVIGAMKNTLTSIEEDSTTFDEETNANKESRVAYTEKRYLSHNIRLRDMRQYLNELKEKYRDGGNATTEEMGPISIYYDTLNKVVHERSRGWRTNPFNIPRKRAERKLLKQLQAFTNRHMEFAVAADDLVAEKCLPGIKGDLNKAEAEAKASEMQESKEMAISNENKVEKEHVDLGFLAESNNVKEVSQKVEQHSVPQLENVISH
jgi:hypothetical protein